MSKLFFILSLQEFSWRKWVTALHISLQLQLQPLPCWLPSWICQKSSCDRMVEKSTEQKSDMFSGCDTLKWVWSNAFWKAKCREKNKYCDQFRLMDFLWLHCVHIVPPNLKRWEIVFLLWTSNTFRRFQDLSSLGVFEVDKNWSLTKNFS